MICCYAVGYKTADKNGGGKWDQVYKVCPDLQQNLAWSSYKSNDNLKYRGTCIYHVSANLYLLLKCCIMNVEMF